MMCVHTCELAQFGVDTFGGGVLVQNSQVVLSYDSYGRRSFMKVVFLKVCGWQTSQFSHNDHLCVHVLHCRCIFMQ